MNDYNTSGHQRAIVHVSESLDLEIAGEHVGQLFLRGWDGWGAGWMGLGWGQDLDCKNGSHVGLKEKRGDGATKLLMCREKLRSKLGPFTWAPAMFLRSKGLEHSQGDFRSIALLRPLCPLQGSRGKWMLRPPWAPWKPQKQPGQPRNCLNSSWTKGL